MTGAQHAQVLAAEAAHHKDHVEEEDRQANDAAGSFFCAPCHDHGSLFDCHASVLGHAPVRDRPIDADWQRFS